VDEFFGVELRSVGVPQEVAKAEQMRPIELCFGRDDRRPKSGDRTSGIGEQSAVPPIADPFRQSERSLYREQDLLQRLIRMIERDCDERGFGFTLPGLDTACALELPFQLSKVAFDLRAQTLQSNLRGAHSSLPSL